MMYALPMCHVRCAFLKPGTIIMGKESLLSIRESAAWKSSVYMVGIKIGQLKAALVKPVHMKALQAYNMLLLFHWL